jgi:D-serine deaminase-like pyridoxal phosphate-dependent protein
MHTLASTPTLADTALGRGGGDPAAAVVFLNVTAVLPDGHGYLTVFPCGDDRPTASNVVCRP